MTDRDQSTHMTEATIDPFVRQLADRLEALAEQVERVEAHIKSVRDQYEMMWFEINRQATFLPPATKNCPKCKKRVSPKAPTCGCGHVFDKSMDTRAGQPS